VYRLADSFATKQWLTASELIIASETSFTLVNIASSLESPLQIASFYELVGINIDDGSVGSSLLAHSDGDVEVSYLL
jgi:hypothetical protein